MKTLHYLVACLVAMAMQMGVNWLLTFELTWTWEWSTVWTAAWWLTLGWLSVFALASLPVRWPGIFFRNKRQGAWVLFVVLTLWRVFYMTGIPSDWPVWLFRWQVTLQVTMIILTGYSCNMLAEEPNYVSLKEKLSELANRPKSE